MNLPDVYQLSELCQADSSDLQANDAILRQILCHYLASSVLTTLARSEDSVEKQVGSDWSTEHSTVG